MISWRFSVCVVFVMMATCTIDKVLAQTCAQKFSDHSPTHSACLAPLTGAYPTVEGVSAAEKNTIVNKHNTYRRNVNPTSSNMQKMYWDNEIAMVAQKWASNCHWGHDANKDREIPGMYRVGQNAALGQSNWGAVVSAWHSEVSNFQYGQGPTSSGAVGHYTQVVWAASSRIGCGYAQCSFGKFYVCNYAPAGNLYSQRYTPYATGTIAAGCPNSASNGLCDCGGKACSPIGTLDPNSCSCTCRYSAPWIQQNNDCKIDCSKRVDHPVCSSWPQSHCTNYSNVKYQYCPIKCQLC